MLMAAEDDYPLNAPPMINKNSNLADNNVFCTPENSFILSVNPPDNINLENYNKDLLTNTNLKNEFEITTYQSQES